MGFKSVKKQFAKVKQKIQDEKDNPGNTFSNEYFFKPRLVKGEVKTKYRIRILPIEEESSTGRPWLEIRYHMFEREGDNKYIKVIDPKTFDPKALNPIGDLCSKLFNSGNSVDEEQAKKLYRKPRYFVKVYIKEAPENQKDLEGQVLIYEASKTLYDKWMDEIEETDPEEEAPFWDPFEGKDFLLTLKQKGDWPDYSDSKFVGSAKPIAEEDQMEEISDKADKIVIKEKILDRDPLKSAKELNELLHGGKNADSSVEISNEEITDDEEEIQFDEDDIEDDDAEDKKSKNDDDDDDESFDDELDNMDFSDEEFDV